MRPPQGFEWLLILFIILLLFGAKRLPDMARGVGRSLRILKAETRELTDDDREDSKPAALSEQAEAPAAPASNPPTAEQVPPADKPAV